MRSSGFWIVWLLAMLASSVGYSQDRVSTSTSSASAWTAGFDWLLLQPRVANDLAIRREEEDLGGNVRIRDFHFEHDLQSAPRFWLAYESAQHIGIRVSGWLLESDAETLVLNPPANGFGSLTHAPLSGVDLSSVVPAETLTAASSLRLHCLDLEITKRVLALSFDLEVSTGLRQFGLKRTDQLDLFNAIGNLAGFADLKTDIQGLGPTLRIATERPAFKSLTFSASLQTSLLFAESSRRLYAIEDLDLITSFETDVLTESDVLVPMLDLNVGTSWHGSESWRRGCFIRIGLETHWWSSVGSLHDAEADLALVGLSLGAGRDW